MYKKDKIKFVFNFKKKVKLAKYFFCELLKDMGSDILVSIVMGSQSDFSTMKAAADVLSQLEIAHETKIVSAHRTPDRLYSYAKDLDSRKVQVVIAGAGGAAHLPGMVASMTKIPVLGIPISSKHLNGLDSLLSIVQMPAGVPVGTFAIGIAGAKNAALFAASILANNCEAISTKLQLYRKNQKEAVLEEPICKELL